MISLQRGGAGAADGHWGSDRQTPLGAIEEGRDAACCRRSDTDHCAEVKVTRLGEDDGLRGVERFAFGSVPARFWFTSWSDVVRFSVNLRREESIEEEKEKRTG